MDEIINREIENGKIVISEDVICTIAGIATAEVEGVCGMASNIVTDIAEKIGKKNLTKGIKVEINDNAATVEVHFIAKYGVKLTEVCWEIQERVKKAIETMSGMEVVKVNAFVEGIYIEKEPKKAKKVAETEE